MDKRLQILRHLFGDEEDSSGLRDLLGQDEELRREHQALSEVKFWLDHRPAQRPDRSVIDNVVTAAATSRRVSDQRRPGARIIPIRYAVAASVVTVALAVGLWSTWSGGDRDLPVPDQTAVAETETPARGLVAEERRSEDDARAPALARRMEGESMAEGAGRRPAASLAASGPLDSAGAGMTMVRAPRVPDWNGGADMVRLRRRIGVLQARNRALDWDNAAVPLEMMPVRRSTAEEDVVLQHAGSSENP